MKSKKIYEVNISIMLIVGIVLLIWGITLLEQGITIRNNLKHIHRGDVDVARLKEGSYITADRVNVLGARDKESGSYMVYGYVYANPMIHEYYMVNLDGKNQQYFSLKIDENQFFELGVGDIVDENGYMGLSDRYDVFHTSYDFKVVEADGVHLYSIQNAKEYIKEYQEEADVILYDRIALVPVNYEKEKKELYGALSVLICAVMFIVASKPWKMVEVREVHEREFKLVRENIDMNSERDMLAISELIRSLRLEIRSYTLDYDHIRGKVKKNALLFGSAMLLFVLMKEMLFQGSLELMMWNLSIFTMTPVVFLIKLLIYMVILILNQDTYFARSVMSMFNTEPFMSAIHERQAKLEQLNHLIREEGHQDNE